MNGQKVITAAAVGMLLAAGAALSGPATRPRERTGMSGEDAALAEKLRADLDKLRPLHRKLGKPRPGDWLDRHREPGQTFAEYLRCRPVRPVGRRRRIYIQPVGDFTAAQRRVVRLTADFMGRYFSLPVEVSKALPLSVIPARARRTHPTWGDRQILTGYVLDKLLRPRLAKDAAACLALTASDLWPGRGWNFVFGQASLRERVGVWSIYRNGDPAGGAESFRLCLLRTMKTAVHETAHMFSMLHCTRYECGMCGSNHRGESDRRPVLLCPECMAKVCWATRTDPVARYGKLREFFGAHGFKGQAEACVRHLEALGARVPATRPAGKSAPATRPPVRSLRAPGDARRGRSGPGAR